MPLLKGKNIDLKLVEKDNCLQFFRWTQDWDFVGEFWSPIRHVPEYQAEREFVEPRNPGIELTRYYIQKKDAEKIGFIAHLWGSYWNWMEIGYALAPSERGKGYMTEAVQILVDFLFLTKQLVRIQAVIVVGNEGSQRVVEKAGFSLEGELRNSFWTRGEWKNTRMYSITREEWKGPRIFGI